RRNRGRGSAHPGTWWRGRLDVRKPDRFEFYTAVERPRRPHSKRSWSDFQPASSSLLELQSSILYLLSSILCLFPPRTHHTMNEPGIADRMRRIDASGIRNVFDLAANMTDPINLSIGQPHFDTPEPIKQALCRAVAEGKNAYSQTQGIAPLLDKIQRSVDA